MCRACRGHGARRSVRAGETIDRPKPDRRRGRRERHGENPLVDRGNISRRGLHQRYGPVCASAGWAGCSPISGPLDVGHVPAAVQLGSRPSAQMPWLPDSLPGWGVPCPVGRFLARLAGSILARADQMRSSISITPCGRAMAMPSRRRARLYRRQGLQYAARYDLHTAVGAGDRHRPACAKQRPTRCAARRACSPTRWRPRAAPAPRGR